jgi:hypothetical protein
MSSTPSSKQNYPSTLAQFYLSLCKFPSNRNLSGSTIRPLTITSQTVELKKYETGIDVRTTIMLRNIPNRVEERVKALALSTLTLYEKLVMTFTSSK